MRAQHVSRAGNSSIAFLRHLSEQSRSDPAGTRMNEILSMAEPIQGPEHLTESDRIAIREIHAETAPAIVTSAVTSKTGDPQPE